LGVGCGVQGLGHEAHTEHSGKHEEEEEDAR
jgi:hypothetical protein